MLLDKCELKIKVYTNDDIGKLVYIQYTPDDIGKLVYIQYTPKMI